MGCYLRITQKRVIYGLKTKKLKYVFYMVSVMNQAKKGEMNECKETALKFPKSFSWFFWNWQNSPVTGINFMLSLFCFYCYIVILHFCGILQLYLSFQTASWGADPLFSPNKEDSSYNAGSTNKYGRGKEMSNNAITLKILLLK